MTCGPLPIYIGGNWGPILFDRVWPKITKVHFSVHDGTKKNIQYLCLICNYYRKTSYNIFLEMWLVIVSRLVLFQLLSNNPAFLIRLYPHSCSITTIHKNWICFCVDFGTKVQAYLLYLFVAQYQKFPNYILTYISSRWPKAYSIYYLIQ